MPGIAKGPSESQPPPTLVQTPSGKQLVLEARNIAQHAVQLLEQLDRFIRKEVEPITLRLTLAEESVHANSRRIIELEAKAANLVEQLNAIRFELEQLRR